MVFLNAPAEGASPSPHEDSSPNLLLLFPGPVHDLVDHFQNRLTYLSERYRGTVLLSGPKAQDVTFGRFRVVMLSEEVGKRRLFSAYLHTAREIVRATEDAGHPIDAVVSYDPLKSGIVGWRIARENSVPLIVEINGQYTSPENFSDVPNPLKRRAKRFAFRAVARFVLRRAHGIKLLSAGHLDAYRDVIRNPVIRIFPNYVDLTPYRNMGERNEVLFIGHPFYLKGVDVLIDAFKSVSDDFPAWLLKIMGWFPDSRELDRAINGHPRIAKHPPVNHHEIPSHLGHCGIFVLPSRSEAMGRVLIEAMASGKPRVGSNVGGIPSIIENEVDGLLFESEDVTGLAVALRRLMGDASLRARLGESGARRAHEKLNASHYFASTHELYQSVLAASRATRRDNT